MMEWILSACVLTAAVIGLRYALGGRIDPRLQYALWALVLVRLLIPVNFGWAPFSVGNAVPYFAREVLPYRPGAWIDKSKTKVGYEIPFTRTFYEYEELEPAADIAERIAAREKVLMEKLQALFGNGGGQNE